MIQATVACMQAGTTACPMTSAYAKVVGGTGEPTVPKSVSHQVNRQFGKKKAGAVKKGLLLIIELGSAWTPHIIVREFLFEVTIGRHLCVSEWMQVGAGNEIAFLTTVEEMILAVYACLRTPHMKTHGSTSLISAIGEGSTKVSLTTIQVSVCRNLSCVQGGVECGSRPMVRPVIQVLIQNGIVRRLMFFAIATTTRIGMRQ